MLYFMTLMSLFTADSVMKFIIEKNRKPGEETPVLGGRIIVKKYHNHGAMMRVGERNQYFIAMLSLTFSAFVTGVFITTLGRKGNGLLKAGLALILGGAYSNTYDRLKRKYVVDYFSFHINPEKCRSGIRKKAANKWNTIVFNLSDFGIILGAMILVLNEFIQKEPSRT